MLRRTSPGLARNYRLILVAILLVAAVLRIYGLNNTSPPGLEHDEVAMEVMRSIKKMFDPNMIMHPGRLGLP